MYAHRSWANTDDRGARTAKARAAAEARFLTQARGDPIKAAHLREEFYAGMAAKSVAARRKRKKTVAELQAANRVAAAQVELDIARQTGGPV
jgi:hypothetical protein